MKRHILLVMLFLLLFMALPVLAQDTVPVPVEPALPLWLSLVLIIVSSVASGGTVWMIVNRAIDKTRNDPVALKNAEAAADNIPESFGVAMLDFFKTIQNAAKLGEEIFDRIPASSKVSVPPDDIPPTGSHTGGSTTDSLRAMNIRQIGFSAFPAPDDDRRWHFYEPDR